VFDLLGTVLGAILSGGATGILGVVAQRYADYKNRELDLAREKQQQEFELAKRARDIEQARIEAEGRLEVVKTETAGRTDVADADAFKASFQAEPLKYTESGMPLSRWQRWAFVLLDFIRGVVRPGITLYLCVLTTLIYWQAQSVLDAVYVSPEDAYALVKTIVAQVIYLTTTVVLWWFGTRNKQQ
jgi:hypothetical protein